MYRKQMNMYSEENVVDDEGDNNEFNNEEEELEEGLNEKERNML